MVKSVQSARNSPNTAPGSGSPCSSTLMPVMLPRMMRFRMASPLFTSILTTAVVSSS